MSTDFAEGVTLGIETSCDETAAAVVVGGGDIRSSVVASQVDLHATFGGVVPELAGRAHLEVLTTVLRSALEEAGLGLRNHEVPALDAVAATVGPGLVGSLLVGVSEAKALALAWGVPFVGVNHLEGHLFAALLDHGELPWPLVVLLVSGGHTMLVLMEGPGRYRGLGQTLDDGQFHLGAGLAAVPADGLDDGRQVPLLDPVTGQLGADPDDVPPFLGLDERRAREPRGPARKRNGRLQVLEAFPPEPVAAQLIEGDDGADARASLHGGGPRVHARLVDHGSSNVAMLLLSRSTRTVVRRAGRVNRAGRGTSTVTLPPP